MRKGYVLFVDSQATAKDRVLATIKTLKQFNPGDIHVIPVTQYPLVKIKRIRSYFNGFFLALLETSFESP
jgi:hypothetical protein